MGRPDFRRPAAHPAPPVSYALHDDDVDVVGGDVAKVAAKPELALLLGCRWRLPLTWVHNPSYVLLLYQDQLDA